MVTDQKYSSDSRKLSDIRRNWPGYLDRWQNAEVFSVLSGKK